MGPHPQTPLDRLRELLQVAWGRNVTASWVRCAMEFLTPLLVYHLVVALCDPADRGWAVQLLSSRPLQFIGEISFSIYLVHGYVYRLVATLLLASAEPIAEPCDRPLPYCTPGPLTVPTPGLCTVSFECFSTVAHAGLLEALMYALSAVGSIAIAWLLTKYVERPMTRALVAISTARGGSRGSGASSSQSRDGKGRLLV